MDWIYLDNNATTRPAAEVVQVVHEVHEQLWANPSSVHRFGQKVRYRIELARGQVAKLINARDRDLVFTSGGTESNCLALRGLLDRTVVGGGNARRLRGVLITTTTDHAAVRQPAGRLAGLGVSVVYLPVDRCGQVDPDRLAAVLDEQAVGDCLPLVSIHWANNETGAVQPIAQLAAVCHAFRQQKGRPPVLFHSDATQAVGKIPVDVKAVPVDLLTMSAHKLHGPKGVGALFVRDGVRLAASQEGGPQERARRGGTENSAGIIGFGVAAELAGDFLADRGRVEKLAAMRNRFEEAILERLAQTVVHARSDGSVTGCSPARLWNTTNVGFGHLLAEAILLGLSERGVCASAGAACSSGSLEPSPVLLAMGVPEPAAHGSVRFSLSRDTREQELTAAVEIVTQVVGKLAKTMPMGV